MRAAALLVALSLAGASACAAAVGAPPDEAARGVEPPDESQPMEQPQVKLGEPAPDEAAARERAIDRAKKHLAAKLDLPLAAIALVSAKAATWSDASLGCPEPDRMYAQVVTSGHEVVLEAQGTTHELHVGPKRVAVCVTPRTAG